MALVILSVIIAVFALAIGFIERRRIRSLYPADTWRNPKLATMAGDLRAIYL